MPNCVFHSRPGEGDAKMKSSEPLDAASLIAEALKRKFAHRYRNDSESGDKEDFKLPIPDVKPRTEAPLVREVTLKSLLSNKLQTPQNQPFINPEHNNSYRDIFG